MVHWWGKLQPPDNLKDFHEVVLEGYREMQETLEGGQPMETNTREMIEKEMQAIDAPTRELLTETGCVGL